MSGDSALLYCAGGGIGDSLVASVVAQALRGRFDRVDALTLPGHRAALERCPDLDDVLTDEGSDERELAGRLAQRGYAACVTTWATAHTARVVERAKIPIRVGQARRLYSWRFTRRVPVRSETGDVTSPWSDILLDYARALGCDAPGAEPRFVPTAADEAEAARVLASVIPASPNAAPPPFVIMHPANAEAARRGIWPTQGWSALARALAEELRLPVLVSGSGADVAIVDAIVRGASLDKLGMTNNKLGMTNNKLGMTNDKLGMTDGDVVVRGAAGLLGIGGFGALAERAALFVGITTGTMHVAAAVGCPTLGIFPFQSDFPDRWAPRGGRTALVRPTYACHPGDTKERCADYACVANLDVARIVAEARKLLAPV